MKQLSVIVPVYNVEQYIRSCVESIYRQGLDEEDFEVILVNDGTPDNSFGIIKDVIQEHKNIIVIEQPNQGMSIARNNGLFMASGQYVLFVDSDDQLVENSISSLLFNAIEEDVDLLIADFFELSDESQLFQKALRKNDSCKKWKGTGSEYLVNLFDGYSFVWRSIYKRSFLICNNISFIPSAFFEDVPFTIQCLLSAKKCQRYFIPIYYYIHRKGSSTDSMTLKKLIDINIVLEKLWMIKKEGDFKPEVRRKLVDVIFDAFSSQMWYMISIKKLYDVRKVVIKDLRYRIPVFLLRNSIKQFLVSFIFYVTPNRYIQFRRFVDILIKKCKGAL